jgi:tRNA pseudouridine55 synthase
VALEKRYETVARFGAVSSTGDPEGEISETGRVPDGPLVLPTGTVRQRPPAYSAVKVDGRRAYERARAGEEVVLAEREVTVSRFEECSRSADGTRRSFVIECSSGTYVRSLIADLGDAYCEALRRTAVGPFEVSAADPDRPIALFDALAFLPEVHLGADAGRWIAHGRRLDLGAETGISAPAVGVSVRISDPDGPVAIGEVRAGAEPTEPSVLAATVGLRG